MDVQPTMELEKLEVNCLSNSVHPEDEEVAKLLLHTKLSPLSCRFTVGMVSPYMQHCDGVHAGTCNRVHSSQTCMCLNGIHVCG